MCILYLTTDARVNTGTPSERAEYFKSTLTEIKSVERWYEDRLAVAAPEFSNLSLESEFACFHLGEINKRSSHHICKLVQKVQTLKSGTDFPQFL